MSTKASNFKRIINDRRNGVYITEDTRNETELALKHMTKNDLTIFIHHSSGLFGLMNLKELLIQMKLWKQLGVKCLPFNHKKIKVGKEDAWMWIIQPEDLEEAPMSPLSIAYGTLVSGFAYISKTKSVGEMVIRYLGCDVDKKEDVKNEEKEE